MQYFKYRDVSWLILKKDMSRFYFKMLLKNKALLSKKEMFICKLLHLQIVIIILLYSFF
jgi:hypothetical protein